MAVLVFPCSAYRICPVLAVLVAVILAVLIKFVQCWLWCSLQCLSGLCSGGWQVLVFLCRLLGSSSPHQAIPKRQRRPRLIQVLLLMSTNGDFGLFLSGAEASHCPANIHRLCIYSLVYLYSVYGRVKSERLSSLRLVNTTYYFPPDEKHQQVRQVLHGHRLAATYRPTHWDHILKHFCPHFHNF
ncbi:hypothetical protein E2C01_054729 [Portunus trituberculatus]|uniref:Uncharacterized protein n=1 Tax=Portunus trituberculatus TaxID=210409 RepID=A0A5B7GSU5_PORTR|nr:hypothetical protein [Portunus trituberculatus]